MFIKDIQTKSIKKILIIQLGDIGDVVWVTPTIWAVKAAFPSAQVSVLLCHGFRGILENDPSLAKVFEIPAGRKNMFESLKEQVGFLRRLRQERFDMTIDLRAGDRGAINSYLTGAPVRVAVLYREGVPFWRNHLFTHLVDPPESSVKVRGAAEQSLRIVRELGIEAKDTVPHLWVSEGNKTRALKILEQHELDDSVKRVSINPFSRWNYKEWPATNWIAIIDWLWNEYQLPCMIVGAPEERDSASILVQKSSGRAFNVAGETTLGDLKALLFLSRLHIGVDSAAPHIAAAVGTPTITIYGPSDWIDWAPVGDRHRVVTPDCGCAPCRRKGCDGTGRSRCLEELGPEKVKAAVKEALAAGS
ncbi:MAG: glycosyltransferase family 9 protein [Pseudomonadota bacterium]